MSAVETQASGNRSYEELEQAVLDHFGVDAKSRMVELERPRMKAHVLEYGQGAPALLMHGGDGEGWNFAPLMAELKDDLHMYAVDRPSFGRSDHIDYRAVPDLRQHAAEFTTSLLDGLGIESAIFIASSFSGIFALSTALQHPERVRALILPSYAAGVVRHLTFGARFRSMFPLMAQGYADSSRTAEGQELLHNRLWGIPVGLLPRVFYEARAAGSQLPGCEELWKYLRRRVIGPRGMRGEACFVSELHRIQRPVLQLWGADELNNVHELHKAISNFPDCRFVLMPNVGHFPHFQAPADSARYIRQFLPTVETA